MVFAITKEPRPSANLYPRPRFRPRENGTLSFPLCRLMPYTDGSAYSITDGIADGISDGIANDIGAALPSFICKCLFGAKVSAEGLKNFHLISFQ